MAEVGDIDSIVGQRWPRSVWAAISPNTLPDIVTPGISTKVTVNAKGLVTALGSLTASDVPALPESKITGLVGDLGAITDRLDTIEEAGGAYYEPVTNGDSGSPELIFIDGDVVVTRVSA